MDEESLRTIRNQAIHWAIETHPKRFNIEEKPSVEEILERAKKFEIYLLGI